MSTASLCFFSREALELHFEGICYGPIAHTQALGTLLFALRPERVDLATAGPPFAEAMKQVLKAAESTSETLSTWADRDEVGTPSEITPEIIAIWVQACCGTAPDRAAHHLRTRLAARLGARPWGDPPLP